MQREEGVPETVWGRLRAAVGLFSVPMDSLSMGDIQVWHSGARSGLEIQTWGSHCHLCGVKAQNEVTKGEWRWRQGLRARAGVHRELCRNLGERPRWPAPGQEQD